VKNLNSIRNVKRAIDIEVKRLASILDEGGTVLQETRSYDADNETTFSIRTKEDADDYRYFPEPDLAPFHFDQSFIDSIKKSLPSLPEELINKYTKEWNLTDYDARVLCEDKAFAAYFESIANHTKLYKGIANWMNGPLKSYLNENNLEIEAVNVPPSTWAGLLEMIESGKVNFSVASHKMLPALMEKPNADPMEIATSLNILQDSDSGNINEWVDQVLAKMPEKVAEYRKGKKGLIGLFVGEVKKMSGGKADPKITNDILVDKLNKS